MPARCNAIDFTSDAFAELVFSPLTGTEIIETE